MRKWIFSIVLVCCILAGLLPVTAITAQAEAGALLAEKGYTLSPDEEFNYTFTPAKSGIYQLTVDGRHESMNEQIWLSDPLGNIITYDYYWYSESKCLFFFLEEGKAYTYSHVGQYEGSRYYFLEICYYTVPMLTLDSSATYSASDSTDWQGFVAFTPTESGWYTFKDNGNAYPYLNGIWCDGELLYSGFFGVFSEQGLHFYCEGGVHLTFGSCFLEMESIRAVSL